MTKLSFSNLEVAFKSKSNAELKKANFLFKTMASPGLVKFGGFMVNFALKIHFPIGWAVKPTIYSHFVGGETIPQCNPAVKKLADYRVKSILDYSVEGKEADQEIESALKETIRSIENAAVNENIPFAVFKPTAFGKSPILEKANENIALNDNEKEEILKFKERIDILCRTAYENNIPILIDAEDSWFQNIFDEVVRDMMKKYNTEKCIVYNTLQMYRWDRLEFLKKEYELAVEGNYYYGAKFVRGAYMEKERERAAQKGYKDPIQPNKEATDNDYNAALKFSIEHLDKISIFNGTHNEYSNLYLTELMKEHNIQPNDTRVYFSQLFGMSDNISFNLADHNYNIAKYVPYGPVKNVMPYLLRRMEENTSVKGQTGRELNMIKEELKRRKNS